MKSTSRLLCGIVALAVGMTASAAPLKGPDGKPVEDFYSLRPDPRLKASSPTIAERDDRRAFTREIIGMQWRPLDPVTFYVIKPKGVVHPKPIFYIYSYPQNDKRFLNDSFCERITANGCAAIGFASALTGDRYRNRPAREWFVSELRESLVSTVHDITYLLNYLETRHDINTSSAGIFGTGSGGTIAILAASAEKRIKSIDVVDPWGDWPNFLKTTPLIAAHDRAKLTQTKFVGDLKSIEPFNVLKGLRIPVRIQRVDDDEALQALPAKRLKTSVPKSGTYKQFADTQEFYHATAGGAIFKWLPENLKSR